jgi:hypothetical protein
MDQDKQTKQTKHAIEQNNQTKSVIEETVKDIFTKYGTPTPSIES